jgi:hypothetical protein
VNQIKAQIEAIGDKVNGEEMVMITLNGLPRSWDAFIQGICSRRKQLSSVGYDKIATKKKQGRQQEKIRCQMMIKP